jgi:rhodanese-related sulfurtransferase
MQISCHEAREMVMGGAQLLDVRSAAEFAEGAAPGAMNIPVQMLERYTELLEKDKPVIVYCRSGNRSAMAADVLRGKGFRQVRDLGSLRNYFHCQ